MITKARCAVLRRSLSHSRYKPIGVPAATNRILVVAEAKGAGRAVGARGRASKAGTAEMRSPSAPIAVDRV